MNSYFDSHLHFPSFFPPHSKFWISLLRPISRGIFRAICFDANHLFPFDVILRNLCLAKRSWHGSPRLNQHFWKSPNFRPHSFARFFLCPFIRWPLWPSKFRLLSMRKFNSSIAIPCICISCHGFEKATRSGTNSCSDQKGDVPQIWSLNGLNQRLRNFIGSNRSGHEIHSWCPSTIGNKRILD
jgi:hypothetical protein